MRIETVVNYFPLVSSIVSTVFAGLLTIQYIQRRKRHQLIWSISLAMWFLTTLLEFLAEPEIMGGTVPMYKLYYGLAAPMVALLGADSLHLLTHKPWGKYFLLYTVTLSIPFSALTFTAAVDPNSVAQGFREAGGAMPQHVRVFSPLFTVPGSILLIGGALYSFLLDPTRRYNLFIALGGIFPFFGGLKARFGDPMFFSAFQTTGVILLFLGFVLSREYIKKRFEERKGGILKKGGIASEARLKDDKMERTVIVLPAVPLRVVCGGNSVRTNLSALMLISMMVALMGVLPARTLGAQTLVTMPYEQSPNVVVDGTIGVDEYPSSYSDSTTGIVTYWVHNGTYMYIALVSPGTGWVGVGFGPSGIGMDGANMIMGWVETDGKLTLYDEIGVGWDHYRDVDEGGMDDIVEKAGSESGGKTTLEFIFPLDSGDPKDHSFAVGSTYGFFVAYHATADDVAAYHTARSDAIDLYIEPPEMPNILPNANFTYAIHGLVVEFTDQSLDPDGNVTSWLWNFGDGSTSTEQNPAYTFPVMDTYTVSLTVTDDQEGSSSTSRRIMVPTPEERMTKWVTQVAVVSLTIFLVSFFVVGIATRRMEVKGGK